MTEISSFEGVLGIFTPRSINYEDVHLDEKVKAMLSLGLGAEMCVFGNYMRIVNLAFVFSIYLYQNIVLFLDYAVDGLKSMGNDTSLKIAAFITKDTLHKTIVLFICGLILAGLAIVLVKFFFKLGVFIGCLFLLSFGPVRGMLEHVGLTSGVIQFIAAFILSLVLVRFLEGRVLKFAFIALFATVGVSLIMLGLNQLHNFNFILCYQILRITPLIPAEPVYNHETLYMGVSILMSSFVQFFICSSK
ncbi:hypothetical protein NEHOM01_1353 [Nematocida homosporus]|uniref:uncharacterized protein n=1 Tax=Nematocida homosporus TaxID=1912981 RepID=UPI00221EFE3B|nr:uncharacterized protein NEHOM01_1353 [Nematocida homosporus]KAI5186264.1 hypothetical protein NEHOM01_1353 [Nematocida homosporus]